MDTTLSIKSAETRSPRLAVAYTPKEAPASSKTTSEDAVKVVLSGVQEPAATKPQENKIAAGEAEQLRKVLETEVNRTAVKFNVSVEQSSSSLRFVVVEQETGKIIREYPPEEVLAIKKAKEEQKKEAIDALV